VLAAKEVAKTTVKMTVECYNFLPCGLRRTVRDSKDQLGYEVKISGEWRRVEWIK